MRGLLSDRVFNEQKTRADRAFHDTESFPFIRPYNNFEEFILAFNREQ